MNPESLLSPSSGSGSDEPTVTQINLSSQDQRDRRSQFASCLAEEMQRCLRKTDLLGRYGGEEFCVLLSHTPLEGALTVAARIRRALASLDISEGDHKIRVTGSLGVATLNPERDTLETLIQRADFKMYTSKQMGRNRVSS